MNSSNNQQNHLPSIESIREKLSHAPALTVQQAAKALSGIPEFRCTTEEAIARLPNLKPKK
ncbi:hypothetical protein [Roseivirga pacifica]|uniref:hypothetical protein n=1 Tax=Roseivirga pacifica TaxID=1267423 RepID=UPI0020943919|nr:hypothetical protein [Roseivirga pacifica]